VGKCRQEKLYIKKGRLRPKHEIDFLFSPHISLLEKIDESADLKDDLFDCENACSTSGCYLLKQLIIDSNKKSLNTKKYYKIVNTGTLSKYVSLWGKKPMRYVGDDYLFPVVEKSEFHNMFSRSYGRKVGVPKLII
jgi:hypothetical protein